MTRKLLLSGHKPTFELFNFDSSSHLLEKASDSPAPTSSTWLEKSPTLPNIVYASSETENKVYCLSIEGEEARVIDERTTVCTAPVHFAIASDGSALITGGLGSGETIYIPLQPDGRFAPSASPLLTYPGPYPYKPSGDTGNNDNDSRGEAKFPHRQTGPHVHGLTISSGGDVYINDLGSDTTWIAERDGESGLRVVGNLESHRGDTPRHSVLSQDEKYLYVNSELQSQLLIYSTTTQALLSRTDVTPPHLTGEEKATLLTAEMYLHPHHPQTLYVSNRGALRLHDAPSRNDKGDSISIILLNQDGSGVERITHLETGLDWPRGMRISDDGRWLAVAGEYGGGLEIYEIGGERGEILELRAKERGIKDVNCVLWLYAEGGHSSS